VLGHAGASDVGAAPPFPAALELLFALDTVAVPAAPVFKSTVNISKILARTHHTIHSTVFEMSSEPSARGNRSEHVCGRM
jgi:hypothetical protein